MKRTGGSRRKSRNKFSKNPKDKGKLGVTRYLKQFEIGQRVVLKAEPSVHEGLYHQRHHGKSGIVQQKRGGCYEVLISDFGNKKTLIVHPVHLKTLWFWR